MSKVVRTFQLALVFIRVPVEVVEFLFIKARSSTSSVLCDKKVELRTSRKPYVMYAYSGVEM